jgi:hypothetical protein
MASILSFSIALLAIFATTPSYAWTEQALTVPDRALIAPNDLSTWDFYLTTEDAYEIVPGSLEWIRLDHELMIPRAKVRLTLQQESIIRYRGHTYLSNQKKVEIPILLLDEPGNEIAVEAAKKIIAIKFRGTPEFKQRVTLDSTCSAFPISISKIQMPTAWAMISCRPVHLNAASGETQVANLKILWQGHSEIVPRVAHFNLKPDDPILLQIAFGSNRSDTLIERGKDSFQVDSQIPNRFKHLSVSVGLGPYLHNDVVRPFFTVYAGYYLNEQNRMAAFSAVPIGDSPHLDQGLYLVTEQARALDDRLSVYLLLGAHALEFTSNGKSNFAFSAPQGIEMQYKDPFVKRTSVTIGSFYYPEINGRSYVNGWIRYAWGSGFLELNYIRWKEWADTTTFTAKSFGISYGFPLFKAF